jgi:hypothetical protein
VSFVATGIQLGAIFTVTVEPVVIHVLSVVERTLNVYVPAAIPVKLALAWYVVPLIEYSTPDCVVKTMVPVGVPHVGCAVTLAVGVLGADGTVFTVTVEPVVIHVLSVVERTLKVYVPAATPVKVALAWYVVPLIEYSTPDCVVKTMVPVGVPHVGCAVTLAVGVLGADGTAFTVTVEPVVIHLLSVVERTLNVYVPAAIPVKLALAWYVVPLIEYSTPDCVVKTMVPVGVPHVG